jgi:hypothetical protein
VIVGGMPRSGTTLMAQLLGSHSEIAIPPTELGFFDRTWPLDARPDRQIHDRGELERRIRELFARDVHAWGLDEDATIAEAPPPPLGHRDLYVYLLDRYRRSVGKSRLGEKSINYQRWFYILDGWFDDYRFVHVVRQPLDAYSSIKWWNRDPTEPLPRPIELLPWIHDWNASASEGLRRSQQRSHRHVLVRYEDIVDQPQWTLDRVCAVAGVEPEPERMLAMRDYERRDNSSFEAVRPEAEYDRSVRRSDGIDRRARLDPEEIETIRALCGSLAHLLGYDLGMPRRRGALGRPLGARMPAKAALRFAVDAVSARVGTKVRGR